MKNYNTAQRLLIAIGGTAALVAGFQEHYIPDQQTPKKAKQRPHRLGGFSKAITDMFTAKQKERLSV